MSAEVTPPSRRGRPPSEVARRTILTAAAALLDAGGLSAVTIEAVAARAKVGKPTIYRHWPNATALAMAALIDAPAPDTGVAETASPLADLRRQLARVAAALAKPRGRQIALMLASADADTEIAKVFRGAVILRSRQQGRALLERAQAAGEVAAGADLEIALDLIYGPIFYRLLVGHAPLTAAFTAALLELALSGLAA